MTYCFEGTRWERYGSHDRCLEEGNVLLVREDGVASPRVRGGSGVAVVLAGASDLRHFEKVSLDHKANGDIVGDGATNVAGSRIGSRESRGRHRYKSVLGDQWARVPDGSVQRSFLRVSRL
jgi:hypothetical protein